VSRTCDKRRRAAEILVSLCHKPNMLWEASNTKRMRVRVFPSVRLFVCDWEETVSMARHKYRVKIHRSLTRGSEKQLKIEVIFGFISGF
jgi:hypothetical protein